MRDGTPIGAFGEPERRRTSLRAVVLVAVLGVAWSGCRREEPPAPSVGAPDRTETSSIAPSADLGYLELVTGDAKTEDPLPMVVGIHGLGGTPEDIGELYASLPVPARIILPRAFIPWRINTSWFAVRLPYDGRGRHLARGVALAAKRVSALVERLSRTRPTRGSPVISGFSQGGMISFAMAVNHPGLVGLAIPIGGGLPDDLVLGGSRLPPIRALHGDMDDIVPIRYAEQSVARLRVAGADATITRFPGVGHAVSAEMQLELFQLVADHAKQNQDDDDARRAVPSVEAKAAARGEK